jgi:hypothetical protein
MEEHQLTDRKKMFEDRLEKLAFSPKLLVGEGKTPTFIHPIALVEGFVGGGGDCIDIDKFIREYKLIHKTILGGLDNKGKKVNVSALNQTSEDNLKKLLLAILEYYKSTKYDKCNIPRLAYMLATVRIESYAWRTGVFFGIISEQISYAKAEVDYGCGTTARRKPYARDCGCRNDGDGYKYRGRGFVQITWKINYQKFNGVKGINFSDNPEKMLDFDILIGVMVEGMEQGLFSRGNKLSKYFNETTKDYLGARYIINSTDKNTIIAGYAEEIEKCLIKSSQ